jgi:membrane fusion protein, multidrug efflux system
MQLDDGRGGAGRANAVRERSEDYLDEVPPKASRRPEGRMNRARALILAHGSMAALAAAGALTTSCRTVEKSAGAAESATKPLAEGRIAVRLAEALPGPVTRPIHGTGVVRLKSEADLSFKVGGVIAAVLVEEGAVVKKGQILARLDPTEVDAALRQAKDSQTKARRDLDRVRRLQTSGALPPAALEDAETGASLAGAQLSAAAFNAQRSVIVAPDDGRIDRRLAEAGEVAAPGRPLFHFSGRSRGAIVRLGLTDRDVLRVREGDPARVVLDAKPEAPLDAVLSQIATVASPGSGTFEVEVRLSQPDASLLSGLTAKVAIAHEEPAALVVPVSALVDGKGHDAAVFVVEDDRARRVPVKVAFLEGDRAALSAAAILPRARVVDAGANQLAEGTPVRVVE